MENFIEKIENYGTLQEMEQGLLELKHNFETATEPQKQAIREAVRKQGEKVVAQAQLAVNQAKEYLAGLEQREAKLIIEGKEYDLDEWVTVSKYCQLFNIANSSVVSNDIKRNKMPTENYVVIPRLNNLCLVKAVQYK